jgi:hypothetical protein
MAAAKSHRKKLLVLSCTLQSPKDSWYLAGPSGEAGEVLSSDTKSNSVVKIHDLVMQSKLNVKIHVE